MVWFNGYRDGKALATEFLFTKLRMTAVRLPIDIDQFYCPQGNCPPQVRDPVRTTTWSMVALNKEGNNFWNWTKPYILLLPLQDGGVAITDARFIDIQGTSSEWEAIKIMCRKSVPCRGIYLENVDLSWANHIAPAQALVQNANGSVTGMVKPQTQLGGNWSQVVNGHIRLGSGAMLTLHERHARQARAKIIFVQMMVNAISYRYAYIFSMYCMTNYH